MQSRIRHVLLSAGVLLACAAARPEVPEIEVEFETPGRPPVPSAPAPSEEHSSADSKARGTGPAGETAPDGERSTQITGRELIERAGRSMLGGGEDAASGESPLSPAEDPPAGPLPPGPDRSSENKPAFGADAPSGEDEGLVEMEEPRVWKGPSALKVIGALILVAGALGAGLYFLRRFYLNRMMPQGGEGPLQVVSRVFVEPGRSILLVRVGGRLLVLASTREGLNRIGEITDKEEVEEVLRDAGQGARKGGFADVLEAGKIDLTDEDAG